MHGPAGPAGGCPGCGQQRVEALDGLPPPPPHLKGVVQRIAPVAQLLLLWRQWVAVLRPLMGVLGGDEQVAANVHPEALQRGGGQREPGARAKYRLQHPRRSLEPTSTHWHRHQPVQPVGGEGRPAKDAPCPCASPAHAARRWARWVDHSSAEASRVGHRPGSAARGRDEGES